MKIGELSEKYESGGAGIGTISSGWVTQVGNLMVLINSLAMLVL